MNSDKLILGTVQFGLSYGINNQNGKPDTDHVFQMLDYSINHGITELDTADAYGDAQEIIGKYHNQSNFTFKINTKFRKSDISLKEQFKFTCNSLNIENINVNNIHSFNDFMNYPELSDELKEIKHKGLINHIGISIYDNKEFLSAIESEFIDVIQFPYNLLDNRSHRSELISLAKSKGKKLHARSIFLQGLFFKNIDTITGSLKNLIPELHQIRKISENINVPIAALAFKYVYDTIEIDNILFGSENIEQLQNNLELKAYRIPKEAYMEINQIKVEDEELLYPKNW